MLKITPDELPMEWGVYGGCLLCPLYPLLLFIERSFTICPWLNTKEISGRSKQYASLSSRLYFGLYPTVFFISFCQCFCLNTESRSRSSRRDLIEAKLATFYGHDRN